MLMNTKRALVCAVASASMLFGNVTLSLARSHSSHSGPIDGDQAHCFVEDGGVLQRDCGGTAIWNVPLDNDNAGTSTLLKTVRVVVNGAGARTGRIASVHWFANNELGTALFFDRAGRQSTDSPSSQVLVLNNVEFRPRGITHLKLHLHQGARVRGISY
jgi:hypothetical protein